MGAERPTRRTAGVVVQPLGGELLVYDTERHRAHALQPRAAALWQACDGRTRLPALARAAGGDGPPLDEDVVRAVLQRLDRAHLLCEPMVREERQARSRREVLRRAAALGGLSVLTVAVPGAAFAASCIPTGDKTCVDINGWDQTHTRQCCSGSVKDAGKNCGRPGETPWPYICR